MHFGFPVFDSKTRPFSWFYLSLHIQFGHKPWIVCLSLHIWKCWDMSSSVLLMSSSPSCHQMLSPFVPTSAHHIWTQAVSNLVERTIHQNIRNPSVLIISIEPGSLWVYWRQNSNIWWQKVTRWRKIQTSQTKVKLNKKFEHYTPPALYEENSQPTFDLTPDQFSSIASSLKYDWGPDP